MWCGIDFGTTNCSLSLVREQGEYGIVEAQDISSGAHKKVMRNVVLFSSDRKEIFAGDDALVERRRRSQSGEEYYFMDYYKPLLDKANLRQTLTIPKKNGLLVEETLFPNCPSREELVLGTGAILKKILQGVRAQLSGPLDGVVIGVPTLFSHLAKCRILSSLVEGGLFSSYRRALQLVKFVPEPVAASMLFTPVSEEEANLLVFDFGGGSLDLALLRCKPDKQGRLFPMAELALGGLELAGRHIDEKIYREVIEEDDRYRKQAKNLSYYDQILHLEQVESLKKRLSFEESVEEWIGNLPFVFHQKKLEFLLRPELNQIESALGELLAKGNLSFSQVDTIVMVGGSSVIPCVQRRMESLFPKANERGHIYKPDPGEWKSSPHSYEQAITGISQGLALYHHREEKNREFFSGYSIWDAEKEEHIDVVPHYVSRNSGPFRCLLPISPHYPRLTISLFRQTIDYEFLLNLVDLPYESGEMDLSQRFELEILPDPTELFPRIRLFDREKEKNILEFCVTEISEDDLRRIFQMEKPTYQAIQNEVVPPIQWSWRPSPKLLEVGDVIRVLQWKNGQKEETKPFLITSLVSRQEETPLKKMETWALSEYLVNGQVIQNRDLHLLSLDMVLVEEREAIAEKLENLHQKSKIVRFDSKAHLASTEAPPAQEAPLADEGLQPVDEEKLFSDMFRSFKRLTSTYNTMFLELNRLKGHFRDLEEETIVRSELDLEIGTIKKQLDKFGEGALKLAEFSSDMEQFGFRLAKFDQGLSELKQGLENLLPLPEQVQNLTEQTDKLEQGRDELAWNLEKKYQNMAAFFPPLEKALASLREEVGLLQGRVQEEEQASEKMEKSLAGWGEKLLTLEKEALAKIEDGERAGSQRAEELEIQVRDLEEKLAQREAKREVRQKQEMEKVSTQITGQKKQIETLNQQMEMMAKESLFKVGSEVTTLRGKFLKYKRRGIIWATATVFWGLALLGSFGTATYLLRQELENQHLVASGNIALAVRDYESAEKYFQKIEPTAIIGMAKEERARLVALAQAGKHIEMGNRLLGDGHHKEAASEFEKALRLFQGNHLIPKHVQERLNRVKAFARADKLSAEGQLFRALSLYLKISGQKTDVPGSLYARAKSALLLEKIKTMAGAKIAQQKWKKASGIYKKLAGLYPNKKIFSTLMEQTTAMDLAIGFLKKQKIKKAQAYFKNSGPFAKTLPLPLIYQHFIQNENPSSFEEHFWQRLFGQDSWIVRDQKFQRLLRKADQALLKDRWEKAFRYYNQAEGAKPSQKTLCQKGRKRLKEQLFREIKTLVIFDELTKAKKLQQILAKLFPKDQKSYEDISLKIQAREYLYLAQKAEVTENFLGAFRNYKKSYYYEERGLVKAKIRYLASLLVKKQINQTIALARGAHFAQAKKVLKEGNQYLIHTSDSLQKQYKNTLADMEEFESFYKKGKSAWQRGNLKKGLFYFERAQYIYASPLIEKYKTKIHAKLQLDYHFLLKMAEVMGKEGNWEGAREILKAARVINPKGKEVDRLKDRFFFQRMLGLVLKKNLK